MSGVIGNGLSALLAAQRALQTTSNNISNVNTEGYVRQRVVFAERPGQTLGNFTIGQGVGITGIERVYDQFLTRQLNVVISGEQRQEVYSGFATRLDGVLGNPDTGITTALQRFFDQVEAVGREPTSMVLRQQLLLEGDSLAAHFQQADSRLVGLADEVNGRLGQAVNEVNTLAAQLARLNENIAADVGGGTGNLLDQQDELLRRLSAAIDITTTRQPDGTVSVLVGSGQALVLGNRANELATVPDEFDGTRLQLAVRSNGTLANISSRVSGGQIGGLLAFRSEVLDAARGDLGRLAVGLAETFNAQHRLGTDLNGAAGGDFFLAGAPFVSASTANGGAATRSAAIDDVGTLTGRDLELRFDGAAWQIRDRMTGAAIPATGSGTAADPLRADGLAITVSGAASAGDRFLVRPTADGATTLAVILSDAAGVAAAGAGAPAGSGDNANIVALSDLALRGLFAGGTQSLANLGASIIASAGAVAARGESDLRIQQTLRGQAELDVERVSGVNLEEEAADLLRFQQAYMAAGKVIGIANDMFQNLLHTLGR